MGLRASYVHMRGKKGVQNTSHAAFHTVPFSKVGRYVNVRM